MGARKRTAEKEPEQKFVLRLPESLHQQLRHVAIDRKTSLNALIVEVVEEWWAKQPERGAYRSHAPKPAGRSAPGA